MLLRSFSFSLLLSLGVACAAQAPVTVSVDINKPLGPATPITAWFGYDEGNYTTTANGRALLRELHDAYSVPVYIRAHHLLTSGDGKPALKWSSTNVYSVDAQGKPVYDFTIIDQIFDAYRDAGVRPMVELGFMPEALATGSGPYYVAYPKTLDGRSQNPPKDYAAWGELCRVLTAHLVERYGRANAAQWYWEVWNEPNISYWHASREDYFKLYDYAVAGVRAALPEARVGGPATTSPRSKQAADYLDAFLKHIANDKSAANGKPLPLDFISFHAKGSPRVVDSHVQMGIDKELTDADKGFAIVASFAQFKRLPIILSEADPEGCAACSAKEKPENNYRNGTLYPAYTAAAIKGLYELADRHGVNLISMLSWSFEFEGQESFAGFRDLSTNGVDKPVMNVFRMAGMMSGERVATASSAAESVDAMMVQGVRAHDDVDALATHDGRTAAVMLWDYHDDNLPGASTDGTLHINGLPEDVKRVLVEQEAIDSTHSNAYTAWQAMGTPAHPDAKQTAQLQQAGQLQPLASPVWVEVKDGTITLPFALERHAVELVRLSW